MTLPPLTSRLFLAVAGLSALLMIALAAFTEYRRHEAVRALLLRIESVDQAPRRGTR